MSTRIFQVFLITNDGTGRQPKAPYGVIERMYTSDGYRDRICDGRWESADAAQADADRRFRQQGGVAVPEPDQLQWNGYIVRAPSGDLYEVAQLSSYVWQTYVNSTQLGRWQSTEAESKAVAQADYESRYSAKIARNDK